MATVQQWTIMMVTGNVELLTLAYSITFSFTESPHNE